jgi:hypothetical protein
MLPWSLGSAELSKLQLPDRSWGVAGDGSGPGRWKPDQVGIVRDLGFTLSVMGVESP